MSLTALAVPSLFQQVLDATPGGRPRPREYASEDQVAELGEPWVSGQCLPPGPAQLLPFLAGALHAAPRALGQVCFSSPARAIVMRNTASPLGAVVLMHGSWRLRRPAARARRWPRVGGGVERGLELLALARGDDRQGPTRPAAARGRSVPL